LDRIPTAELDAEGEGQLRLTRALLLYQAGSIEASFNESYAGLEAMRSRGAANVVAVQLQTGLGVARSLQGRYSEAASYYERALEMATLLGNESLISRISANLALAYGRLGRFDDQLGRAEASPIFFEGEFAEWNDIQLTYSIALVHGLNGRLVRAQSAIARLEERLSPKLPHIILQRWLLWKADVLMVSGLRSDALQVAVQAVHGHGLKLDSLGFAGPFARWTAVTCLGSERHEANGARVLAELEERLEEFDALDQLEILCANAYFGHRGGAAYSQRILEKAARLPTATLTLLRSLGMASCPQRGD
jgi:tetratricopeptide (TPR) repeat protein